MICAPARYGKTVLAYQYASKVFSPDEVMWIDAASPVFFLALDARPSAEFTLRFLDRDTAHHKELLFVIDGCPVLSAERLETLQCLIADLLAVGHEVLLTTRDTSWLEVEQPVCTRIDARMLLLDARERTQFTPTSPSRDDVSGEGSPQNEILFSIVGFASQGTEARESFVHAMMEVEITSEDDALAIVMLVLEQAALHELRAFVDRPIPALTARLERRYPHVGITALNPVFHAISLTDAERFQLIRTHLASLAAALPNFEDEESLTEALIASLLEHDRLLLATQLACGSHDDSQRATYLDDHARSFLFTGHPLFLLHLARTLPRAHFEQKQRWLGVAIALGILGEKDAALRVMATFGQTPQKSTVKPDAGSLAIPVDVMTLLVKIAFNMAEDQDVHDLAQLIDQKLAPNAQSFAPASARPDHVSRPVRPDLSHEVLVLVRAAANDPCQAALHLHRMAAAGFSLKQTLIATCLFASIVLFVWRDRLSRRRAGSSQGTPALDHATPEEQAMLESLERHIVLMLSRQVDMLPANVCALFLFDCARDLFGDRAYLLIDDRTLAHIEQVRKSLVDEQKRWRDDPHAPCLVETKRTRESEVKSAPTKKALRINALGRFELEPFDQGITIKNKVRKQMRLLISLLAINDGREVARKRIQRIMWPDVSERNARQSLYTTWSLLNKSVIDANGNCPFFESYPQSIALNAHLVETDTQLLNSLCKRLREETLDRAEYERAIDQIEDLYRGPLLPGDETAEVVAQRKRYQDRLLEALLVSGMRLRKQGESALALRYFRFAFDNEPTREDICYQLMFVLWKLGRHGEALNEYFVCRRSLIDQFGMEGTAKLRDLYETILSDASLQA